MNYAIMIAAAFILATIAVATMSPFNHLPQGAPQESVAAAPPPAAEGSSSAGSSPSWWSSSTSSSEPPAENDGSSNNIRWPAGEAPE